MSKWSNWSNWTRSALSRLAGLALCLTLCLAGQQAVNQADGPPSGPALQTAFVVNGSNQVIGVCYAKSLPDLKSPTTSALRARTDAGHVGLAISAISKANPAVVTATGHGFTLTTRPQVSISGALGTGWVSGANTVNGTWVATVIDANTFSIPVNTTGNGTLSGTVVYATTAPVQSVAEWSVQVVTWTGTNPTAKAWLGAAQMFTSKCSDVTSTTVGLQ